MRQSRQYLFLTAAVALWQGASCFLIHSPISISRPAIIRNNGNVDPSVSSQHPFVLQVPSRCHFNKKDDSRMKLYSLTPLIESISSAPKKQTIFVGGKGGVGKTTVASALAVQLALQGDLNVLVVSTDPAHSLGDALDEDLRRGRGKPMVMTDPLTGGRLHAAEVNADAALQDFRESLASFDIDRLASTLGVSVDLLESLGLKEFSGLLNNPPPGLDELVALGNVMDDSSDEYDVVVVDTAPTGHTLRLLALPQFIDGLLGKLIKLRMKLSGLASTLQAFLGDAAAKERTQTLDNALDKLEEFRLKISKLEQRLKDSTETSFVVVTIPTKLAVSESKRLVTELTSQGIAVTNVVINQCVGDIGGTCRDDLMSVRYGMLVL
jgi:arsenite-transporting ATPase